MAAQRVEHTIQKSKTTACLRMFFKICTEKDI